MGFLLFFIPAVVFGLLTGCNSLWWILGYFIWGVSLGNSYAEWVNGGRLGSGGLGVLFLQVIVFLSTFILSTFLLPSFSILALFH